MHISETRSALVLLLASGLLSSVALAADEGASSAQQADSSAQSIATPAGNFSSTGSFFGSSAGVSPSQAAATPSYEVGGAGVASGRAPGGILTSAARGRAVPVTEGLYVYPAIQVGIGYNDNLTSSQNNKIDSAVFVTRPEVVGEVKKGGDRYTLSYHGNYANYASSTADDYYQHEFWGAGDNYFTSRARMGWGVGYVMKTDPRGSTDNGISGEPDRWHAPVLRAVGSYGAKDAIGRVEVEGSWMQKRYDNNRVRTQSLDVDLTMLSGRFFYRVMPKTSMLFELRNTWANYTLGTSTSDNTDTRAYVGVVWDVAAKTTGTFKVGGARKSFSDSSRSDATMASWEGGIRWMPLTYSTFDLSASRGPADSTGQGNFILNTGTTLMWTHKWASYISSRTYVGYVQSDYDSDPRKDKTVNAGIGFFRDIGNNARIGVDYTYTDRNSNQLNYDFRRNVLMMAAEVFM